MFGSIVKGRRARLFGRVLGVEVFCRVKRSGEENACLEEWWEQEGMAFGLVFRAECFEKYLKQKGVEVWQNRDNRQ